MIIRLIAALVILFSALWLVQLILIRARGVAARAAPRQDALRDLPLLIGFFGAILLALSFVEAARREVLGAWQWGMALGVAMSAGAWGLLYYRWHQPPRAGESALCGVWRFARAYGTLALIGILGIYLSVRIVGVGLEVFFAGALGVLLVGVAVALFARERLKKRVEMKEER